MSLVNKRQTNVTVFHILLLTMSITFKFSENNSVIKEINAPLASLEDLLQYRVTLKTIQKDVNAFLTELVNADSEPSEVLEKEEEDLTDSDSEEEKLPKRNLKQDQTVQKTKVKKSD